MLFRTPTWWADHPVLRPPATEIRKGYLDAFEPDYLVDMCGGAQDHDGGDPERVLTEKDLLDAARDEPIHYGVDVLELYEDLYRKEFQFERRHPPQVVLPRAAESRMTLFIAACCGEFPPDKALRYLTRAYRGIFDASLADVDGPGLFAMLRGERGSPLRMGSVGLEPRRRGWPRDPTLFFMDGTSAVDLIDYWNLRAMGWWVLPVPCQWSDALVPECSRFIEENHVPYRHDSKMMHHTNLMCSRSVPAEQMRAFAKRLTAPGPHSLVTEDQYPRIWDEWVREHDRALLRWDVLADEADVEVTAQGSTISFSVLRPPFVERAWAGSAPRWANVIRVRDYGRQPDSAPVIPAGLPDVDRILKRLGPRDVRVTGEGIVITSAYPRRRTRLMLPSRLDVFRAWAHKQSLEIELSGAGRLAEQLIRGLGGLWGVQKLAHEEVIALLERMASGLAQSEVEQEAEPSRGAKLRGRIVSIGEWLSCLKKVHEGSEDWAKRHLHLLVRHKVLQLGLRLQCPLCAQHNWYGLDRLAEEVTCERCLGRFDFPATDPPRGGWYYRTVGPFSVENYAQGSYCVALALRLLGDPTFGEHTWIPPFVLRPQRGEELEADFAAFWRESSFDRTDPVLIFGECKTYGQFQARDVRRMRRIAQMFPGAVIAFCTLRKRLAPAEKKRIASFAGGGRKILRGDRWLHPVLVLTGTELFSALGPPDCWEEAGGRFAKLAQRYRRFRSMMDVCDVTQQLHLGMESHGEWLDRYLDKRYSRGGAK